MEKIGMVRGNKVPHIMKEKGGWAVYANLGSKKKGGYPIYSCLWSFYRACNLAKYECLGKNDNRPPF